MRPSALVTLLVLSVGAGTCLAQDEPEILNWPAPPYWASPPSGDARGAGQARSSRGAGRQALAGGPVALPFIALPPCRIVDTRGNAPLTGGFLPPATLRSYTVTGVCGIPAGARALSLNATVVKPTGPGFLTLYPEGGSFPPVSTLNYLGNDVIVNAAVVPLSAGGGISMALGVSGGDVVLDTNGYYAPAGVSSLNLIQGDVTLQAGTNVTFTPSGNGFTIAATGGPGGSLPAGTSGQTLRHNGSAWVPSGALANDGTNVSVTGSLVLPLDPSIDSFDSRFLRGRGTSVYLGLGAGPASGGTSDNTAIGYLAYATSVGGAANTAVGSGAISTGGGSGFFNTAVGKGAYASGPFGSFNVAVGSNALGVSTSGDSNIALGSGALGSLTAGSGNIAIGTGAGGNLVNGSSNIYIVSSGIASDNATIRIGAGNSRAFLAGVRGVTTGQANAIPVFVDSAGQLGTVSSSARTKRDIADMGEASARLMQLRPVTFRYRDHGPDAPVQFGLVAEEVGEVMPELVARSRDGEIETVLYHELPAMLLNELQKALRRIDALEREITALKAAR